MTYEKYDAHKNDCMFYLKSDSYRIKSKVFHEHKWINTIEHKNVALKFLWHFHFKQRLQWIFTSSKKASLMKWHAEGHLKDGNMRHPTNSSPLHIFDYYNAKFSNDASNVRLRLALDGFNPFRTMNGQCSSWLVVLIPYNQPHLEMLK